MVNEIRVGVLGKKGSLKGLLKVLKNVPPEGRPKVSQMVNEVRERLKLPSAEAQKTIERKVQEQRLASGDQLTSRFLQSVSLRDTAIPT